MALEVNKQPLISSTVHRRATTPTPWELGCLGSGNNEPWHKVRCRYPNKNRLGSRLALLVGTMKLGTSRAALRSGHQLDHSSL
jgi:hypothetical protein